MGFGHKNSLTEEEMFAVQRCRTSSVSYVCDCTPTHFQCLRVEFKYVCSLGRLCCVAHQWCNKLWFNREFSLVTVCWPGAVTYNDWSLVDSVRLLTYFSNILDRVNNRITFSFASRKLNVRFKATEIFLCQEYIFSEGESQNIRNSTVRKEEASYY